jgi:transcription antitermination factor NusG
MHSFSGQDQEVYMDELKEIMNDTGLRWYVMVHQNPRWIETMLLKDSHGQFVQEGAQPLPPYEFFVPFQFLRPSTDDELRDDLRNFVFVQVSASRIHDIVNSEWNTGARSHLHHYRDTDGREVTIPDSEMQQLRTTLQSRQLKVFFGQPVGDMAVGDTVILQFDPWKGKVGKIEKIAYKKNRLSMTVGVNIMNRTKSVKFEDLHDGDVLFADEERGRLLSGNLLENFENEVVSILGHKFREKSPNKVIKDRSRLIRLLSYANMQMADADDHQRFTALMLLCSYLLFEKEARDHYKEQVTEWLDGVREARTATEAYLMVAMFVVTRKPKFRDAAKAYRKAHPDCPDIIRRFLSKVRDIR